MQDILRKAEEFTEEKLKGYLEGLTFPASKEQIITHAKAKGVPGFVMDQLEQLPDKTYTSAADVAIARAEAFL
jgi:hypothetical protein